MLRAQPVDAFSSLYETSKFSDLTVELKDGQILMLHKALVCRLDFFRAACDGSFREATENYIKFPDEPPNTMKALFKSLYGYTSDEVVNELSEKGNQSMRPSTLLSTYDVATKYSATCLESIMCEKLEVWLGAIMLTDSAIDNPVKTTDSAGWLWYITKTLDDTQYESSSLRAVLVKGIQQQMAKTPEDEKFKRFIHEGLLPYTNITTDLLKSGGLDGTGAKLSSK